MRDRRNRKKDSHRRAMCFLVPVAFNGDPAAMPLNELFRDKEPDTRADRCMRRKERVKDSPQILRTNANTVISHCERHTLRLGFTVANFFDFMTERATGAGAAQRRC